MGYPNWYEGVKDNPRPKRPIRAAANMINCNPDNGVDTPLDEPIGNHNSKLSEGNFGKVDTNLIQALAQEMMDLVKGKQTMD